MMLRPDFSVQIGSQGIDAQDDEVVSLIVRRSMGLPIDSCEVQLARGTELEFEGRDPVDVKMGYDGKLEKVFSGSLDKVEHRIDGLTVTALGPCSHLLRLKINRVFSSQTAGKIVRALAQEAGVKMKDASDGISLPLYVIDSKLNAYQHVLRLAQRCNFDVYADLDRRMLFKERTPGKNHTLKYGKDIISAKVQDLTPRYTATLVRGESPSSSKGSDTSTWLTKQDIKGEAGKIDRKEVLVLRDPAIKDKQTAENVAKARLERISFNLRLTVECVGWPSVDLADIVSIEEAPRPVMNASFDVMGVEHHLSNAKGFTTAIMGRGKGEQK